MNKTNKHYLNVNNTAGVDFNGNPSGADPPIPPRDTKPPLFGIRLGYQNIIPTVITQFVCSRLEHSFVRWPDAGHVTSLARANYTLLPVNHW
jgi:hypothetical protein